jgi:hypothetical protein
MLQNSHCVRFVVLFASIVILFTCGIAASEVRNVPSEYPTIQSAIDASVSGDDVFVSASASPYNENILMKDGVNVVGSGYPTINGQNTNAYTVHFQDHSNPTLLEGFIVTNDVAGPYDFVGGIYIANSSPIIRDCSVQDIDNYIGCSSEIWSWGAGALIILSSEPHFVDCVFSNNRAIYGGAVGILDYYPFVQNPQPTTDLPAPVFTNCTFEFNEAISRGGAVYFYSSCLDNFASCDWSTAPQSYFDNCQFIRNRCTPGGSYDGSVVYMKNSFNTEFNECIFFQNGYAPGIISAYCSGSTFRRCTFAQNPPDYTGLNPAILNYFPEGPTCHPENMFPPPDPVVVENCLFAFNEYTIAIDPRDADIYDVQNTDFYGNKAKDPDWIALGSGNINIDPLFCDLNGNESEELDDRICLHVTSQCTAHLSNVGTIGAYDCFDDEGKTKCSPVDNMRVWAHQQDGDVLLLTTDFYDQDDPGTYAVTCPQGDLDHVVIEYTFLPELIQNEIAAANIEVGQPWEIWPDGDTSNDLKFFGDLHADAAVTPGPDPNTTITIENIGGSGHHAINKLYLFGFDVGGRVGTFDGVPNIVSCLNITGPDLKTTESSCGIVNLVDLSYFGTLWTTSQQKCFGEEGYEWAIDFDYTQQDRCVNLNDLNIFTAHFGPPGHKYPEAAPLVSSNEKGSGAYISFTEIGGGVANKVRYDVSIKEFKDCSAAAIWLNEIGGDLVFHDFERDPTFKGLINAKQISHDGNRYLLILAAPFDATTGDEIKLGTISYRGRTPKIGDLGLTKIHVFHAEAMDVSGNITNITNVTVSDQLTPVVLHNKLTQNYPNPFNPITTIEYSLSSDSHVNLSVYDAQGRLVRTLEDSYKTRDTHQIKWDGRNNTGNLVASGVYWYRLVAGDFMATKRMVLLK